MSFLTSLIPDSSLGLFEVAWQYEPSQIFLGSPSILKMRSGELLVSADRFGSGFKTERNVSLYRSTDDGESWTMLTWVKDQYWSNLFQVDSSSADVYLLGTSTDGPAPIKIAHSKDGGCSWADSAVLFGHVHGNFSFETGPTPTLIHSSTGRVYRALERLRPPFTWGTDYEAVIISAAASANLTDPQSWTITRPLPFDKRWVPTAWSPQPAAPGYLEGNAIEGPDGQVYSMLRFNSKPYEGNKAVLLRLNETANTLVFQTFVDLPGGHTKFVIRRDPVSLLYLSLTNPNTAAQYTDQRNILVLCSSPDLLQWTQHAILLHDDTGFDADDSVKYTGFHYTDWRIDGQDIVMAVRTAYRGAVSYHNSNRITYKRVQNFRQLLRQRL
mmetsp:Transcript_22416/g.44452  ORF Transcript_22416/g.44452 Transcript_22416/m.44452 type:complete len:384 (+) Transcript_22416:1-1152(+)